MSLHLLIIDDDPALRRLYEAILAPQAADGGLENLGLEVDVASTADSGRSLLARKRYDLALVDLNLEPNSNYDLEGLRILAHIRRAAPCTETVIMSTQDDEVTVNACMKAGANDFLSKNEQFVATLKDCVARAKMHLDVGAAQTS